MFWALSATSACAVRLLQGVARRFQVREDLHKADAGSAFVACVAAERAHFPTDVAFGPAAERLSERAAGRGIVGSVVVVGIARPRIIVGEARVRHVIRVGVAEIGALRCELQRADGAAAPVVAPMPLGEAVVFEALDGVRRGRRVVVVFVMRHDQGARKLCRITTGSQGT